MARSLSRRLGFLALLEDRLAPSASLDPAVGTLSIRGSAQDDLFRITAAQGQIQVNGQSFDASQVQSIAIQTGSGNDRVVLDHITSPLTLQGDGNVTLAGDLHTQGVLKLSAAHQLLLSGLLSAGNLDVAADGVILEGNVNAAQNAMIRARAIGAYGSLSGQSVSIDAARYVATSSSATSGNWVRIVATETLFSSGRYSGQQVDLLGDRVTLVGGSVAGSNIRIGGDFHGANPLVKNARSTAVVGTSITAPANGRVVVWSNEATDYTGNITTGPYGFVEVSSLGRLNFGGKVDPGVGGTLLLDPKDIVIQSSGTPLLPQYRMADPNPTAGGAFGSQVAVLSNGNIVVTDPNDDLFGSNSGAAYLYSGKTGELISTLVGSHANDQVGTSVVVLANGNYVIVSQNWGNGTNVNAGAVTWANKSTGVSGTISNTNSLVGTTAGDFVGNNGITALPNGNYVVSSIYWANGSAAKAGAITWGDGSTGIVGDLSLANSLVGSKSDDLVGFFTPIVLTNGNYVVRSPNWANGSAANAGAVTWGSGTAPIFGAVSSANSLVGTTAGDKVGFFGVTALTNGNYVVDSFLWNNGAATSAGAVTWGDGSTGITGAVSAANSLVGSKSNDFVGGNGVTALTNGNYVVRSPDWSNGATASVGAVTWGDGSKGISGAVTATNSLVGSRASDQVGAGQVAALTNGNYVVSSPNWSTATKSNVGAATWGDGTVGITGAVSSANSLVGTNTDDQVGAFNIIALTNGNYLVVSTVWDNGAITDAGAITFGNGTTGITGAVSAANSLVGSTNFDNVGAGSIVALPNGNYVAASSVWANGAIGGAGAVTWGDGVNGTVGAITAANSYVGGSKGDMLGTDGITILANGNYVFASRNWTNGANSNAGAVTWGSSAGGSAGTLSAANSIVGSVTGDLVGIGGVKKLTDGNYVVLSPNWNNGSAFSAGAVTWANANGSTVGAVSTANSLVGSTTLDNVGSGGIVTLAGGKYVVVSPNWSNGPLAAAGAAILVDNTFVGAITASNALIGGAANSGLSTAFVDTTNSVYLANFTTENNTGVVRAAFLSPDPNFFTFAVAGSQTVTLDPTFLTALLNKGSNVTLQASNDITVNSAISVNNGSGNGGVLTFQAGRSILLNASIVTDNANLILKANEPLSAGVLDASRDPGAAAITMAASTTINTGSGTVQATVGNGAGLTNSTAGTLTLRDVTTSLLTIANTTGAAIDLFGTITGNLTVNSGTLRPGGTGAAGSFTVTGNLTLTASTTLAIELRGTTAGTSYDQIVVGGGVALGGAAISVNGASPLSPSDGQIFTVISGGVSSGSGTLAQGNSVASTGLIRRYALGYGTSPALNGLSLTDDSTAPTSAISAPSGFSGPALWAASGQITGTAADAGSGISTVTITLQRVGDAFYWNGSSWQSAVFNLPTVGTTSWNYTISAANLSTALAYTIKSTAIDRVGNVQGSPAVGSFSWDRTSPTTTITKPTNGSLQRPSSWGTSGQIAGTGSDGSASGIAAVRLTIQRTSDGQFWNGSAWQASSTTVTASGTSSWNYTLAAANLSAGATYTVSVSATDNVGNVQITPATTSFTWSGSASSQFGVGADSGSGAVRFFNSNQSERFSATPFGSGFANGVRVASGDFNGDGVDDLAVGTGPGGASHVQVLDGVNKATLFTVDPFEAAFVGGIFVAVGDLNGDGRADLVISPDQGGGPRVRIFDGKTFNQLNDFFGIDDPNFRGGARAAIGDVDGDGFGDLAVAAGFSGGPREAVFNGISVASGSAQPQKLFGDFFAFESTLSNGTYVALGDVNGDGKADFIAGGGPGGGPRVSVFDGASLMQNNVNRVMDYFAGDVENRGGVRVGVKDLDGDARMDLIVGAGSGAGSRVTAYAGSALVASPGSPSTLFAFDAFSGFAGGVYVG